MTRRSARARDQGRFRREILATPIQREDGTTQQVTRDEGIRAGSTPEKMATLKTVFKPDGVVTAGNSAQITDDAAAVTNMERSTPEQMGEKQNARLNDIAVIGEEPAR